MLGGVGDAEAAAEVDLGQLRRRARRATSACRPTSRRADDLEARGVEDLGADVGVQAAQVEGRRVARGSRRTASAAWPAGEREAELLVLVGGGDELVGVRLDADGDPHHHRRAHAELGRDRGDPVDLVERVDDDPADAGLQRRPISASLLLLPCKPIRSAGNPARSATASSPPVQMSRLSPSSATQRATARAQERLARVVDVAAAAAVERRGERVAERPGPRAEVVLVQHVRRGAVLARRAHHVDAADRAGGPSASRPTVCGQSCGTSSMTSAGRAARRWAAVALGVERAGLVSAHRFYIRSGAETPSRSRPLASTCGWRR